MRSVEEEGEQIEWELEILGSISETKAIQGRATQSFVQLKRPEPYHYEQRVAST